MSFSTKIPGTLVEALPEVAFLADFDGNILEVNKEACRMLGYEKEELLKLTVDELIPEGAPTLPPLG